MRSSPLVPRRPRVLRGVEVIAADASMTDAYVGAVPADLVLLCGVIGNISTPPDPHILGVARRR